jgi:hypothetical protein
LGLQSLVNVMMLKAVDYTCSDSMHSAPPLQPYSPPPAPLHVARAPRFARCIRARTQQHLLQRRFLAELNVVMFGCFVE